MSRPITAVISDFGGVLTSPLEGSFKAWADISSITLEQLGKAMFAIQTRTGQNALYLLEKGQMTEAEFLATVGDALTEELGRPVHMGDFGELYFEHLHPNDAAIDYMRTLGGRGYRMALCTNNVREWEPRWRAMLPVDEIFELVVDSAFVGMRKPDPEIYELTLERLGVTAAEAVFVDDIDVNCDAARELGMTAVHFRDTDQAIADIEAALRVSGPA